MKSLANDCGETVFLGKMDDGKVLYIRRIESKNSVAIVKRLGQRVPAHCTATGLAMMAFMPIEEVDEIVKRHGLVAHNASTVTDYAILKTRLEAVRTNGFAVVNGEYEEAFLCISAPVFDYTELPCASITVAMLSSQLTQDANKVQEIGELVKKTALSFSTELGSRGTKKVAAH